MTTDTVIPRRRGLYAFPILGRIAHDVAHGPEDTIWYALTIFLTLVVLAVMQWGIVALAMTALALVPVMLSILILITRG